MPHNRFVIWSIFFGLIEISFPSLISKLNISRSISKDFFPRGPSIFKIFPANTTLTFSGIAIVSTPKGVMTDMDARKQKVGGEIICKVF